MHHRLRMVCPHVIVAIRAQLGQIAREVDVQHVHVGHQGRPFLAVLLDNRRDAFVALFL